MRSVIEYIKPRIIKGDEIMVINGAIVSDLDMMYLESVLQEEQSLSMMMRSSRTEPPDLAGIMRVTDDMIDSLVCPPPPTDPPVMSEEMISGLIVPAPGWNGTGKDLYSPEAESSPAPSFVEPISSQMGVAAVTKATSRTSSFEIENLLKTAEQLLIHSFEFFVPRTESESSRHSQFAPLTLNRTAGT
uniref:PDZ domain-containing protein n=1 Tax=Glossina austeni TaxID=7395 RepID=A0A1A9VHD9_GLOAU